MTKPAVSSDCGGACTPPDLDERGIKMPQNSPSNPLLSLEFRDPEVIFCYGPGVSR